jgi:hypothetical protein
VHSLSTVQVLILPGFPNVAALQHTEGNRVAQAAAGIQTRFISRNRSIR